jgi:hypothetical protein
MVPMAPLFANSNQCFGNVTDAALPFADKEDSQFWISFFRGSVEF